MSQRIQPSPNAGKSLVEVGGVLVPLADPGVTKWKAPSSASTRAVSERVL